MGPYQKFWFIYECCNGMLLNSANLTFPWKLSKAIMKILGTTALMEAMVVV